MSIRTPSELGAVIRTQRRRLGLDQRELAEQVGVSRKWVVDLEKGNSGAAMGLVLRTLRALKLSLDTVTDQAKPAKPSVHDIDLDAIVAAARKPRR